MEKTAQIFVAGHTGLVGSAIVRKLRRAGYRRLLLPAHADLDLTDSRAVFRFFRAERPEYVFMAAGRVGGIMANVKSPADFIYENVLMAFNVIHQSFLGGVRKLLFLGSSCIYPRLAPQPIPESALLAGALEKTNAPYAVAKIAGVIACQSYHRQYGCNFISVMPTNLYGLNDRYDLETSHVIPALLRKFHEAKQNRAKEVTLWGTGKPRREFLHADDLADACMFLMQKYDRPEVINIGTGEDLSIRELAELMRDITGFTGRIAWDASKPDGTPRKVLDVSRIHALGWSHSIPLSEGLRSAYDWYWKREHA